MLSCNQVTLNYEENIILSHVSFSLLESSITIIRGANGTGKTSLLKSFATLLKTEKGKITWQNQNIIGNQVYLNQLCYIGHKLAIKPELTVLENISLWANLKTTSILIPSALNFFGLEKFYDIEAGNLSSGWQKKLALARLIVTNSSIWLLDEPEVNLELAAIELLLNLIITRANQGGTIIIASHEPRIYQNFQQIYLKDFNK